VFHFVFVFHGFISRGRIKFCDVSQVLTVEVLALALLLLGRQAIERRNEKKKVQEKEKDSSFHFIPLSFSLE
jgi:hypothetical protein